MVKYIHLASDLQPYDERDAYDFATGFLRRDGMFLTRMLRLNAGDVIAAEVIYCLWERFLQRRQDKTHCPMSNFRLQSVGWSTSLEKTDGEDIKMEAIPSTKYIFPSSAFEEPTKTFI